MLSKIKQVLQEYFSGQSPQSLPVQSPVLQLAKAKKELLGQPVYPAIDGGMVFVTPEWIVESQSEIIGRIRSAFGISNPEFESRVMGVIHNYAAWVSLLPATEKEHYPLSGGLVRLGLDVGFYALQASGGKVFSSRTTAEKRRFLEPKWVYATFVAGLLAEIWRPLVGLKVKNQKGEAWNPHLESLTDWALEHVEKDETYYLYWQDVRNQAPASNKTSSALLINQIVPKECIAWLDEDNSLIVNAMTASISGIVNHGEGNLVSTLVRDALEGVIKTDLTTNPLYYNRPTLGSHLTPTILDVMKTLLKENIWTVNQSKSRIWITREGTFLIWNAAFFEIKTFMQDNNIKGCPNSPDSLAESLLNASVFEASPDGSMYWEAILPNSKLTSAVKLAQPTSILGNEKYEVSDVTLFPNDTHQAPAVTTTVVVDLPETPIPDISHLKEATPKQQKPAEKPTSTKPTKPDASPAPSASNNNEDILTQVSVDSKRLIKAILEDYLAGSSSYPVWVSTKGAVISVDEFNSHGIPVQKVLEDLKKRNWLYVDPDAKSKMTHMVEKEKNGVKVSAFIITKTISDALGFRDQ